MQLCVCVYRVSRSVTLILCLTSCLSVELHFVCLCSKRKASRNAGSPWTTGDSCTSKIRWYGILTHTYTHQKGSSIGIGLYFKLLDAWVTMVQFLLSQYTNSSLVWNRHLVPNYDWIQAAENLAIKNVNFIQYLHHASTAVSVCIDMCAWLTCQQCEKWTMVNAQVCVCVCKPCWKLVSCESHCTWDLAKHLRQPGTDPNKCLPFGAWRSPSVSVSTLKVSSRGWIIISSNCDFEFKFVTVEQHKYCS